MRKEWTVINPGGRHVQVSDRLCTDFDLQSEALYQLMHKAWHVVEHERD
jgi:hypothetical protein